MNRKHKTTTYQTEYSSSFKWQGNNLIDNQIEMDNKKDISNKSHKSTTLNEKKMHRFRHRLKVTLLEKLEKLEKSEYTMDKCHQSDIISINSSKISRKTNSSDIKPIPKSTTIEHDTKTNCDQINKHKKPKLSRNKREIDNDICQKELRRSRSLAMEFKQKNESTQIWWLNESVDNSLDEDYSEERYNVIPFVNEQEQLKKSFLQQFSSVHNGNKSVLRRNSFISNKISTTDPSQSTFSKSSFSYQIAQATGYQSTTDELSSFNHDNDAKIIDQNHNKKRLSHCEVKYQEDCLTKLKLPTNDHDKDIVNRRSPLIFYVPYQKEDFTKDTTSSESNINNSNNFDTYRLD